MNEKVKFLANGTEDDFSIYLDGDMLDTDSVVKLEDALANNPNLINSRLQLLFYYCLPASEDSNRWVKHLVWMIENRSSDWINSNLAFPQSITEDQIASLNRCWRQQIASHPSDPAIVGAAGEFVSYKNFELAKELLERALELEPHNLRWKRAIVSNHILRFYRDNTCEMRDYQPLFDAAESLLSIEDNEGKRYGLITDLCNISIKLQQSKRGILHINWAGQFKRMNQILRTRSFE